MVGHLKYPEKQPDGRIRRGLARQDALETSASLMSTRKWIKFINILDFHTNIHWCYLKLLSSKEPTQLISAPQVHQLYPAPCIDWHFPMDLLEIEWIEFPRIAAVKRDRHTPAVYFDQDVESFAKKLERVGKFPLEFTQSGLRIVGHVVK